MQAITRSTYPATANARTKQPPWRGRLDAVLAVLEPGDVLVGHSGGGLEITRAADAAPGLVSHLISSRPRLPLEGRLMQEALVYRDDGGIEGDYDVTGMLKHGRQSGVVSRVSRSLFAESRGEKTRCVSRSEAGGAAPRIRKFGETVYLLEPNVKKSKGGLRDLHLLQWIGMARYQAPTIRELSNTSFLYW